MVARAKRNNKRQALTPEARAWLDGKPCGLFKFKSQDELAALWAEHGEEDNMFWRSRYCLPITREELEAREESWLTATDARFTIDRWRLVSSTATIPTTSGKNFEERGDESRFQFERGMMWPMPKAQKTPTHWRAEGGGFQ
jgi:hypothetical protein